MADLSLDKVSDEVLYRAAALAEGYESVPVSIDQFINDPYYLGQIYGNGGIYPFWVDALRKIYPNPLYSPYEEVCLSGDTKVDLLDGTTRTMAQICADGPSKVFWVLGYNLNTKEWEPCRAGAAKMTGVKPVYRVTLDNGKSFKATGNHKILGKDNRWHRVDSLEVGQSLMPYNLEYDDLGYAWVWDNRTQKKVPRKRLVQAWKYSIPDGYHVHHKNQVKADDRPSNLMCLTRGAVRASKWPEILEQARNYNHRIVAIEELPPEPVFNFTVDILHSYPLSCGIVSSNCITGAIGVGKELSPNTLVVCKRGSVRACEVTMQDEVLGTDGKFHAILGIFPQEPHRFWTFTFNDGSTTTTGEDHIWTVSKYGPRSPHQRWFDTTTRDIVTGEVRGRYVGSGKHGSLYLPVLSAPVDYGDATCHSLPIPPYALGLLIADGCLTTGDVRLSNVEEDVQQRYLRALSAFGCELHYLGHNMYNTVPGGKIKAALDKMGLLCRAEEKHIPEEYLRASVEDRLALLQGYFDGDGCIEGPAKTIPTMATTSKRLSEDLTQLVCSLGGRVTVSKRRGRYKLDGEWHECQDVYYLVVTMPRGVRCFSSAKHTSRWHEPQNEVYKKIVRWEDAGVQQGVCFYVDTPNHLFAVDRYTFTHNTTVSLVGALYDLYHVILLKDPHKKYKLLPTTSIIFSLVTATMDLAAAVMANQFLDAMGASPFFCEHFSPKKGERLDEDMFPHHIGIGFGSRGGHNLGKAVIGAIIDEANFQDRVANQAVENYNTITRRMKSRFMLPGGTLPCRRWVISSRTDSAAFLESHIDAVRNRNDVVIFEPAIWDVQKVKGIYSGVAFPVFVGNAVEQPRILTTDQEVENCAGYVIQVPIEYRTEFEEDLPKSLQDLAGVATRSGVNLIYNVEKLEEALCLDNCMSTDEPRLTLTGDDHLIQYYKKPLPPGNYYVHLDGAKSGDRYGFAMSRVVEQISVTAHSAMTGVEYSKLSPAVDTPLCFGIKALPGSEIPLWKVRQFLVDLRNQHVNIAYVSFDGYQSVDNAQLLAKLGFNCGYSSVDRTKDPYLKLASNISLGLHKMPRSKILRTELLNLQNLPQKIDHPMTVVVDGKQVKGGKDIADAVCASAFNAISAAMTLTQSNMIEQMKSTPTQMSMKERQEFVMKNYLGMG